MATVALQKMMRARGYEPGPWTVQFGLHVLEAHKPGGEARVVYGVPNTLADARRVVQEYAQDVNLLVVVLKTSTVSKKYDELRRPGVEFFSVAETRFDPTDHVYVPIYTVEDPNKHPERAIYPKMIAETDIQARWRGWRPGTVVKATYSDGTSTFRHVV